ncbi:putative alpha/beta hydrolase [Pseudoduganella flava]|uniref:Alpha/beta fold hydrolase n=1 Tax=Pseudoduganella flava TaxID=871742 RepID=A0A562PSY7_9BURK|nr:alpha/beta fold hydrolase [Pseudoduganella flava]QGZ39220.1 alpha/beta fold hydrolase [Pseudoduganella flava]TWI47483.1 putative alpha/beta hydrolase [Pseudoduganella flava]
MPNITIRAADGYPLAATRYLPDGPERARLVVAGATGVPQGFYRRFAEFAAGRGYAVTTFDYRGVGLSAPESLAGFDGDFLDWARLDLAAVVDATSDATAGGGVPLLLVGHSYGGHAFGLLPNHAKIDGMYVFGTGAGWHGWMPLFERLKVLFMWHVAGPILTRRHGYLAWSRLGMGEDLPLGVYRQWRRWCRFPHYFFDDPAMRDKVVPAYAEVRAPIVAVNATDDPWAPPASRDAFMAGYRNAQWQGVDVDPRRGFGKLGHMGYFRPHAQPLWAAALEWCDGLVAR